MIARRLARRAGATSLAIAMVAVVAACGGDGGSPDAGDSAVFETASPVGGLGSVPPATATASGSTATSPGTASANPTAAPTATAPKPSSGSGNVSVDLCAKLPAADVEAVIGATGITVRPEQGNASAGYCSYLIGDRIVVATTYITQGAAQVLDIYAGSSEKVTGIADGAIWVPSKATLFVRRGDSLMGIQVTSGPVAPDGLKAASILLGQTAAGRL